MAIVSVKELAGKEFWILIDPKTGESVNQSIEQPMFFATESHALDFRKVNKIPERFEPRIAEIQVKTEIKH